MKVVLLTLLLLQRPCEKECEVGGTRQEGRLPREEGRRGNLLSSEVASLIGRVHTVRVPRATLHEFLNASRISAKFSNQEKSWKYFPSFSSPENHYVENMNIRTRKEDPIFNSYSSQFTWIEVFDNYVALTLARHARTSLLLKPRAVSSGTLNVPLNKKNLNVI